MQEVNNIQAEVLTRLDAVAAKLGVGAEHLWEIFVRQSVTSGYVKLGTFLLVIAVFATTALVSHRKFFKATNKDVKDTLAMVFWVSMVLTCIASFVFSVQLNNIIPHIVNPEYFAWKEIQQILR